MFSQHGEDYFKTLFPGFYLTNNRIFSKMFKPNLGEKPASYTDCSYISFRSSVRSYQLNNYLGLLVLMRCFTVQNEMYRRSFFELSSTFNSNYWWKNNSDAYLVSVIIGGRFSLLWFLTSSISSSWMSYHLKKFSWGRTRSLMR